MDRRLDRLLDAILPPGSYARRVHELPKSMREMLRLHQAKVASIISGIEKRDPRPGAFFERLIDGDVTLPRMPEALRQALAIPDAPVLSEDLTLAEIAEFYRQLIEGDQS